MNDFTALVDLASERLGGSVLAANDDFFAEKENLLKAARPIWIEDRYTDRGKWMDGWETRRRREPGHDWALIRLGLPGIVRGFIVDTAFFKGNYPESCSIHACEAEADADETGLNVCSWSEILPQTPLAGDAHNRFAVPRDDRRFTHLRLNIYPDGGVARLRVYGRAAPDWARLRTSEKPIDLAAVEHGGLVVASSDMFFGSAHNMLMPGEPRGMHDGWETKRRRGPGHDWAIVELGTAGLVERFVVDTTHFKGNAPGSCSIDGCHAPGVDPAGNVPTDAVWRPLLAQTPLAPHRRHELEALKPLGDTTHVRLNIYPDGGVSRFRAYGKPR
jgi:allantoicase